MSGGQYILGTEVSAFEEEFAAYCEADHCVSVANGFAALQLSLLALGVGPGDEVIVPAHTFIATWLAVSAIGAIPVGVDVDAVTFNIEPGAVARAIGPKTKAIIPVHLYGHAAPMQELQEIALAHDIALVEDAAQAHGGKYKGERLGSLGNLGAFSFYPVKNLGAFGDGGAVCTNDPELAEKLRSLRNYGSSQKYQHDSFGLNSRLDELQAAFLRVKLRHLDSWNERRRQLARVYDEELSDLSGLTLPILVGEEKSESVFHQYVVRHARRDQLREHLAAQNIDTIIHYPQLPCDSGSYQELRFRQEATPVSKKLVAEILSLPLGPHLTEAQVRHVSAICREFLSKA
ncbi:UNVERIFIED_CONTAM: hypothetical protein GTU68_042292 [Idotea baltica]|nr:hypothetical protein [Idotea baltica]